MFAFEVETQFSKNNILALCIFSDRHDFSQQEFYEKFEKLYEKFLKPDYILYFYPGYAKSMVHSIFEMDGLALEGANRYKNSAFTLVEFDVRAELSIYLGQQWDPLDLLALRKAVIDYGVGYLAETNSVIEKAPPGTKFKKPSDRDNREFISCARLCSSFEEELFLAFSILGYLPVDLSMAKNIYLDSHSISNIANALIFVLVKFGADHTFTHKSFGSYGGLVKNRPDSLRDVFVLISASTSNSLMTKVCETWGVPRERVITLLTYEDDDQALCNIRRCSEFHGKSYASESMVRRIGEYFTAEVMEPRQIILKKIHGRNIDKYPFNVLNYSGAFKCNMKKFAGGLPREVFLDLLAAPGDELLMLFNWACRLIDNQVSIKTKWLIIDENDDFAVRFSELIVGYALSIGSYLIVKNFQDMISYPGGRDDGVLAFVPVISSGDIFVSLNRDLRIAGHKGMRVFFSFYHLYRGTRRRRDFKSSISYNLGMDGYRFYSKHEINMPLRDADYSWNLEKEFLEKFYEDSDGDYWKSRYDLLTKYSEGLQGRVGVSGRGADFALSFSSDYAYWDFDYDPIKVTHESVYFMVSSVLQSARENISLESEDSLSSDVYQQSVIAPDNFVRFNDPLLQSCIWRSAKFSELDYSSSRDLSSSFLRIVVRLLKDIDNERGEAAVDLILGICLGKIKIDNQGLNDLKVEIEINFSKNKYLAPLLLKIKQMII